MNWDRYFMYLQRISSVLIVLVVLGFAGLALKQWLEIRGYEREWAAERERYGGQHAETSRYHGEEIETADGSLIAVMQEGDRGQRKELGGITITNAATGKFVEIAPNDASVIQFEVIHDQGAGGHAIGYIATVASDAQYAQGRQDLVIGALPAMTRTVIAPNIRFSDLPTVRGDGSVGLLIWPEDDEAYLVAIRFDTGAIVERTRVKLPRIKENRLSQGPGGSDAAAPGEAPLNQFSYGF